LTAFIVVCRKYMLTNCPQKCLSFVSSDRRRKRRFWTSSNIFFRRNR